MRPKFASSVPPRQRQLPSVTKRQADQAIDAALADYQAAQATLPADAAIHLSIGMALQAMDKLADAEAAYRHAVRLSPSSLQAWSKLAELQARSGRHDEAIASYQAALALDASNVQTLNERGNALQAAGRLDEAMAAYRQMQAIAPEHAHAHNNIGSVLQAQGQIEQAVQHYRRALAIDPHFASAHFNLGTVQLLLEKLDDSLIHFSHTIENDPQFYAAHNNLSATLSKLGRIDEAVAACRHAIGINPAWNEMYSNMLFALTHSAGTDPATLFREHQGYGEQFETPLRALWPRHRNLPDPERVLRIGIVSADLNNHAMANFITPVLENLMHAARLEVVVYCNNKVNDHITAHLRAVVGRWHDVQDLPDDALAQLIGQDGIDILIDLSGHTGYNRLLTFARKPAPLQATWMGYPMTTGMLAMDYYLTDRHFSPPGLLDEQFTEKLLLLPACAPYVPSPEAPAISPAPALVNGHVTFGSFNRANKISRDVVARWSSLLRAVPTARMLVAGMPSEQITAMLRGWFDEEGIAAERLSFHAVTDIQNYLVMHRLVDVCVDTWPYTGGTTTLHALWMGVPTLTMVGQTLPSRVGAAILGHLGLDQFIAQDEADFMQKGVAIASDIAALGQLRTDMRARLNNSAAGQPALIAAGLENALRSIWQRWCAGLPTATFEADPAQSSLARRANSMKALHSVNVDTALVLAIEHHQASRFVEAETLYLAIIHRQPDHAIANHNMGLLAAQLGFPDKALPYLRAAMLSAPGEVQFILSYAQGLLQSAQAQAAAEVLASAIGRGFDTPAMQAALARAQGAPVAQADTVPEASANHVAELFHAGLYAEMEQAAHALVAQHPASAFGWSVLGTALQLQGKDALAALGKVVQLAPADAQAHANLGNAWQGAGQHAAAIPCYLRALELEPGFAEAHGNLGSARHATGDMAGAAASLREAVLIDPGYALAHANLATVLLAMGDLQGATAHYRLALALVPGDAQLQRELGAALQLQGLEEEASACFLAADQLARTGGFSAT